MCSAYRFYPPAISVTWLRNGKEIKGDVTSTEEMADGDWYYQVHSHLEYMPESGEEISCVVQHASFTKPMNYKWGESDHHSQIWMSESTTMNRSYFIKHEYTPEKSSFTQIITPSVNNSFCYLSTITPDDTSTSFQSPTINNFNKSNQIRFFSFWLFLSESKSSSPYCWSVLKNIKRCCFIPQCRVLLFGCVIYNN